MAKNKGSAETAVDVYALDVGHGSCTVVLVFSAGSTHSILIDCGMRRAQPDVETKLQALRTRVARLLTEAGINHLDAIIVSHSDEDHTKGLSGFVDQFRRQGGTIGTLYANRDRPEIPEIYQEFFDHIAKEGARKVEKIVGAWNREILAQGSCVVRILAPDEEAIIVKGGEPKANHLSAIVRINNDDTSLLVCGDASADAISRLSSGVQNVDVVLASHHGGNMSKVSAEVEAAYTLLNPSLVVFSAGHATKLCALQLSAIANTKAALMCTGATPACDTSSSTCVGDIEIRLRPGKRVVTKPPVAVHRQNVQLYQLRACKAINRDAAPPP
jgi:competence protein ComEC